MATLRFATIGSNFIADAFLAAGKNVDGFAHTAVYSRTLERGKEFANKHGCDIVFTSLEEMASCDEIDAVYISSPTSEHARQAVLFLEAGKHVMCEKPAVSNSAELALILNAAKASGCAFMEAMRSLKTPTFAALKTKLSELGPIRVFSGNFCQLSSRWPAYLRGERPNAFLPDLSNGALMDLGCYAVYAAVALLGTPTKVSYTPIMLPTGVDAAGTVVLQYPEAVAALVISKMSHGFNNSEIQTENGTMIIDHLGEFNKVDFQKKGGQVENLKVPTVGEGHTNIQYELSDFIKMVQSGQQQDDVLTWDLAVAVTDVLDRARADAGIVFPADGKSNT